MRLGFFDGPVPYCGAFREILTNSRLHHVATEHEAQLPTKLPPQPISDTPDAVPTPATTDAKHAVAPADDPVQNVRASVTQIS